MAGATRGPEEIQGPSLPAYPTRAAGESMEEVPGNGEGREYVVLCLHSQSIALNSAN